MRDGPSAEAKRDGSLTSAEIIIHEHLQRRPLAVASGGRCSPEGETGQPLVAGPAQGYATNLNNMLAYPGCPGLYDELAEKALR
jgi:hypothetical protein